MDSLCISPVLGSDSVIKNKDLVLLERTQMEGNATFVPVRLLPHQASMKFDFLTKLNLFFLILFLRFGRTCSLHPDGDVVCDCPPGYIGRRCESCAPGFSGNPLGGEECRTTDYCNSEGSSTTDVQGQCVCKVNIR